MSAPADILYFGNISTNKSNILFLGIIIKTIVGDYGLKFFKVKTVVFLKANCKYHGF